MFGQSLYSEKINEVIAKARFPESPENLYDPIRYILSLSGKRIRPLLVLLGADLFTDSTVEGTYQASLAIEYFHNFSLLHDDIMDKAPLRRGKATVHEKWNDNVAILSGDALLVQAYQELTKCPADKLSALLPVFNKTALEVCEGQQMDMDFEKESLVSEADYIEMIRLKTSVLLGGALQLGAILADASLEHQSLLYAFGVNLGIAFQLQDDILDVYGDPLTFGKQVGGDILCNKKTLLHIALHKALNDEDRQVFEALLKTDVDVEPNKVEKMKDLYAKYDILALAIQHKEKFTAVAYEKLASIQVGDTKKSPLHDLADTLMHRKQ